MLVYFTSFTNLTLIIQWNFYEPLGIYFKDDKLSVKIGKRLLRGVKMRADSLFKTRSEWLE